MENEIELKPCPFCGNNKLEIAQDEFYDYGVQCWFMDFDTKTQGGCGAETGYYYKTPEEAAAKWNTRISSTGWVEIKTDDDLPQDENRYLFTVENQKGERKVCLMNLRRIWIGQKVIAYRPIPKAYEDGAGKSVFCGKILNKECAVTGEEK